MARTDNKSKEAAPFELPGVGKQIAKHLARLNIFSPHDLLFHLPSRYQDRTQIQSIAQVIPGEEVVVEGVIKNVSKPLKGKTKLLCELRDETGVMYLRFFHILSFQSDVLKIGSRIRCYSDVRLTQRGLEMVHPEFQLIKPDKTLPIDSHFTAIYPATEGLSQYMLRKLTTNVLNWMEKEETLHELLPLRLLQTLSFPTFRDALRFVHRPPRETAMEHLENNQTIAQKRLIFEELLAHRISLLTIKHNFQTQLAQQLPLQSTLVTKFLANLPFQLTKAQQKVTKEVSNDLTKSYPMLRLVQGDVGSGKTVIAALAMLQAAENEFQAVLMAPTELLAEQHYRVLQKWFAPLNLNVIYLTGHVKGVARKTALAAIEDGEANIIVGTHALFQEQVNFKNLALVIVDEQHRFGVQQRAMLREKGMKTNFYPHQLIMTATPIPRTLAMSFYADLDCSIIDELPPGRTPITTSVIANAKRLDVIERVREACMQGRQVYWVCPLIEESEVLNCQAATQIAEQLEVALAPLKIGLIHGRMRADQKDKMMRAFQQGEINLLVATTVIEVGVDVPNASVMVIENAERLGLSQLHQLRGRVGRGSVASHCVLLYQHPLSALAKERLNVMRETTDGFVISQKDLELRGPGEVLGTRQTGDVSFRVADLMRDKEILPLVQQAAESIMSEHKDVMDLLVKRWLGDKKEYGKV